jgi:hypothetical protein
MVDSRAGAALHEDGGNLRLGEIKASDGRLARNQSRKACVINFEHDPHEFSGFFDQVKRDVDSASGQIVERMLHWNSLSKIHFHDSLSLEFGPGGRLDGVALGKQFWLYRQPIAIGGKGFLEVVVAANGISDLQTEVGRFLIGRDGAVVSKDGETLIDANDTALSYKLLSGILRSVFEHHSA